MFFVRWIAPAILMGCGIYMVRMGIRWFKSGHGVKGTMDVIAGLSFLVIAFSLPFML